MKLNVRFAGNAYSVEVPENATVDLLTEAVQAATGTLVRNQKLIHKGKVLKTGQSLQELRVVEGSSIMLMAASGSTETKGQAAARAAVEARAAAAKERLQQQRGAASQPSTSARQSADIRSRAEGWRKTGVVALRQEQLDAVPASVWPLGSFVRVLDLSGNSLTSLSEQLGQLVQLQRLLLSGNLLTEDGVPWSALGSLQQLRVLHLHGNRLTSLPETAGLLTSLTLLDLSSNQLQQLPGSFSSLSTLRALSLRSNQLGKAEDVQSSCLAGISSCSALLELDLSANALSALPTSYSALQHLRTLRLDSNRLHTIPPAVLQSCTALCTLSCHNNPLTMEQLREVPGFQEYDARRRAKHDKQVDMKLLDTRFDEGADVQQWDHHIANIHGSRK